MTNTLIIDRIEARYFKDGKRAFGFLLMDDYETDAVLCFDREPDVPTSIAGLVELCHDTDYPIALDLLRRCAEERHPALLDGEPVDRAELAAALAATLED
ncbi:MAG: hypothetical protein GC168_00085 [Candidatus Hydrogenedens sp.]|nr:hypothetical protein [Candidatus Hydrogenedens sp.]